MRRTNLFDNVNMRAAILRSRAVAVTLCCLGLFGGCVEGDRFVAEQRPPFPTPKERPVVERKKPATPQPNRMCLQDFLEYRKAASAMDKAYYERIGPDRYRLTGGSALAVDAPAQVFTGSQIRQRHNLTC